MQVNTAIVFLSCLFLGCNSSKRLTVNDYHKTVLPPNCVKVSENLFCDQTEISNLQWLEYLFWTKEVFGKNSKEYLLSLPDTTVWDEFGNCLEGFGSDYLRHPAYRDHPVVGVSQEQVQAFAKWRSDRVFESRLIKLKVISHDSNQTPENYFTVERFFTEIKDTLAVDSKEIYYPHFRLPTLNERSVILNFSDSVDTQYFNNCRTKFCKKMRLEFPKFISNRKPCDIPKEYDNPTIKIHEGWFAETNNAIYNLRGNVSEWTAEKNITVGGGWINERKLILKQDTFQTQEPNPWTGFRNVCEWRSWEE